MSEASNTGDLVASRESHPSVSSAAMPELFATHLPADLLDSSFVRRFLRIFEDAHETVTTHVEGLENLADPTIAPPRMIDAWMHCFALDDITAAHPDITLAQQRLLLEAIGLLMSERGTLRGLLRFLGLLLLTVDDVARAEDKQGEFAKRADPATETDLIGGKMRRSDHGYVLWLDESTQISVSDNGGVVSAGSRTRPADHFPMVVVDIPHTGGFRRSSDLVELIRAEVPAHAYVAVRVVAPGEEPTKLYFGPAAGPADDW